MLLSKTTQYAIRALIYIQRETQTGENRVDIRKIAEAIKSPTHFTAKILQQLVRHGVISSMKGPNGGFAAEPHTAQVKLGEIISIMDGKDFSKACLLGLPACSEEKPCPIHHRFASLKASTVKLFDELTIGTLTEDSLNTYLSL
ncbi:Rrf2 family transcriptional regulator [bacterium SCSIO 12741]|nr:Rrf2 family transcriptional regulator [bacterium SCSIO 12741]